MRRLAAVLGLALAGCSTSAELAAELRTQILPGMTQARVLEAAGRPSAMGVDPERRAFWTYRFGSRHSVRVRWGGDGRVESVDPAEGGDGGGCSVSSGLKRCSQSSFVQPSFAGSSG
jgi:hypothetical protein